MTDNTQRIERLERVDLFALQQVADAMKETNLNLRELTAQVTDLGREVSALTAQNLKGEIDALQRRLEILEATAQQSRGGHELVNWVVQQIPWLIAFGSLLGAFLTHKDKHP